MKTLEQLYQFNLDLLEQLNIEYCQWHHEPILDFETDVLIASKLGWTGTHSKSLFLKLKGGGYALYLTEKDRRLDSKLLKSRLGKKPSICQDEEMIEQLGCLPGAVCPFGMKKDIPIIVDSRLYEEKEWLYTPGLPEVTIGLSGKSLKTILNHLDNQVIELYLEEG